MHLERQVAQLNQIVLEQSQQIERLERELRRQRDEQAQPVEETDEDGGADGHPL